MNPDYAANKTAMAEDKDSSMILYFDVLCRFAGVSRICTTYLQL